MNVFVLSFLTSSVSSISWLENDVFLVAHTPSAFDAERAPETTFNIIFRQDKSYLFRKLPEVCAPYGLNRSPPHHFMQRLKGFPPDLQDVIVVASTASPDVGLFSRSKKPLSSDLPAEKVANVFTTTSMANDARRAQLPMAESMTESVMDTSPLGVALDLSATEKVLRPLPGEEMDSSPGPLPAFMILNNEGILAAWWIVYADSIRQGTSFPGLVVESSSQALQQVQQRTSMNNNAITPTAPTFGQSTSSGILSGAGPATATMPAPSPFGGVSGGVSSTNGGSTFGMTSNISKSGSPWTSNTSTSSSPQNSSVSSNKPSFGATTTIGGSAQIPAFGATGGIGNRGSPWGSAPAIGTPQTGGSTFGQPSGLGARSGSVFGGASGGGSFGSQTQSLSSGPPQVGFANFATGGGFAAAAAQTGGQSPFTKAGTGSFGSVMDTDTSFGGTSQKKADAAPSIFSPSGFTLGSTFTGDGSAKTDGPKPSSNQIDSSMFGSGFSGALGEAQKDASEPLIKEADMDDHDSDMAPSEGSAGSSIEPEAKSEATNVVQPEGKPLDTAAPKASGLFGTQAQQKTTPAVVQSSAPAPPVIETPTLTSTPQNTPQKPDQTPQLSKTPPSPPIKREPESAETPEGVPKSIPEAPLPPDPISKASYAPGDSSTSSKSSTDDSHPIADFTPLRTKLNNEEKPPEQTSSSPEDVPLSPESTPQETQSKAVDQPSEAEVSLPADDEDDRLDDEGSGVDIAQEVSPISDPIQSLGVTPGSSFGPSFEQSPLGDMFGKGSRQPPRQHVKSLFGEVGQPAAPYLPPPTRKPESPRSPSPSRLHPQAEKLRPENARSVSAPGQPTNLLANRRAGIKQMNATLKVQPNTQEPPQRDVEAFVAQRARRQAEEEQDLSDHDDERVREELETEVEGTRTLDDFLAHQDYVGNITKPGIPGLIEKVYRDINSMVDTLGMNARALEAFVKGHSEMAKDGGRSLEDLDNDDWCLIEVAELGTLESHLAEQLRDGRLQDIHGKREICRDAQKDIAKLRTKRADITRFFEAKSDPEQIEAIRTAPLSATQASQQHELRKKYTAIQKLVAEAEEKITLLRTSIATQDTSNGKGSLRKPTVEAVTNTIQKMTNLIEKKSGDIDVLENQMRKLRFASIEQTLSREGSPSALSSAMSQLSMSRDRGVTAAGAMDSPSSQLRRSTGDQGTPRRRLNTITIDEVARHQAKSKQRKEVNRVIQEAFLKAGPRIRTLE